MLTVWHHRVREAKDPGLPATRDDPIVVDTLARMVAFHVDIHVVWLGWWLELHGWRVVLLNCGAGSSKLQVEE